MRESAQTIAGAMVRGMHRAFRIRRTGGSECLVLEQGPVPIPARGEVLVQHAAIGVNFVDRQQRRGEAPRDGAPAGIGVEGVGTVRAVGEGVNGIPIGARVGYAAAMPPGAYADHHVVPAWRLVPIPTPIDDVTAAAVLRKGLTAEFLVRRVFKIGPGHRVLVHAAAGATGGLVCQWLRHVGASVFGVVSTPAKVEVARANGCHHVLLAGDDVVAGVRLVTAGKGVDVVYDGVGKDTLAMSLQCLRPRGLLVAFGEASGAPAPLDLTTLRSGSFFVTRPSLGDYTATRQELLRAAEVLFALVKGGVLRPRLEATLPLADAAQAHARLESRQNRGAIVLLP